MAALARGPSWRSPTYASAVQNARAMAWLVTSVAVVVIPVAVLQFVAGSGTESTEELVGPRLSLVLEDADDAAILQRVDERVFLALPADGVDPAVQVTFGAHRQLSFYANCNEIYGPYGITDAVLSYETNRITAVGGCDEPASMGVVGAMLRSSPMISFADNGDILLTSDGSELRLRPEETAEPIAPIVGEWQVHNLGGAIRLLTSASLTIEADRLRIDGPCTDGDANLAIEGRQIVIDTLSFTPGPCDEQGTEIEAALRSLLGDDEPAVFNIVATKDGMRLEDADASKPGAVYRFVELLPAD